jgi:hypothetical protein
MGFLSVSLVPVKLKTSKIKAQNGAARKNQTRADLPKKTTIKRRIFRLKPQKSYDFSTGGSWPGTKREANWVFHCASRNPTRLGISRFFCLVQRWKT